MSLLNYIIKKIISFKAKDLANLPQNAIEDQNKIWHDLINKCKDTAYGKAYHFAAIKNHDEWSEKVPVHDYDSFKPYIEKVIKGEQYVFWHEKIEWFSKSSGTTADKSKFLPVSKAALEENHYKGSFDVLSQYVKNQPDTKIFSGKSLVIGGSQKPHPMNANMRAGDISAVLTVNQPKLSTFLRIPSTEVTLLEDFGEKLDKTAQIAIQENVTFFVGVPTWYSVLFEKILKENNIENLHKLWPNMELYIHGGVSFAPYISAYKKYFPNEKMTFLQTYNASEGFFAFQDRLIADDMLLATNHGVFYEFIPPSDWHSDNPKCVTLKDVEIGVNYALVITTNAGLWRYKIGDTVVFTSKNPYRIKVSGRTKSFINAFGEELMVDNADQALKVACAETKAIIKDYTAAPYYFENGNKAFHQWLIEFDKNPEDVNHFAEILDSALKNLNSDYEAKRNNDLALSILQITIAQEDTFINWLKNKGKLGGQNKIPRLCNDRKIIEELLALQINPS